MYHVLFDSVTVTVPVATVNAEFGQGATLVARDAKQLGMIDKIAKPALRAVRTESLTASDGDSPAATTEPTAAGGEQPKKESKTMDLATLKKEHPEVFKAMEKYYIEVFGNASSIHQSGREAKAALETK